MVFKEARKDIMRLPLLPKIESEKGSSCKTCHSVPAAICNVCQNSMFRWITRLEEISTVSSLCAALDGFSPHSTTFETHCCQYPDTTANHAMRSSYGPETMATSEYKCNHLLNLTKSIRYRVRLIPSFSEFVSDLETTT